MTWQLALPILTNFGHGTVPGSRDAAALASGCPVSKIRLFAMVMPQNGCGLCEIKENYVRASMHNGKIQRGQCWCFLGMNSPQETSMHCCYPAPAKLKFMENLGSHDCIPMSSFPSEHSKNMGIFISWRSWTSLSDCQSLPLEKPEYSPIWYTAERYLSPSEGVKRALDLREKCPLKNCWRRLPEEVWKKTLTQKPGKSLPMQL